MSYNFAVIVDGPRYCHFHCHMASLRRKPNSKFWIACYTDHTGVQKQRSTGVVDRTNAMRIALTYEDAYRSQKTEEQLRRVMNDACENLTGRRILNCSLKEFFSRWLARKAGETSDNTTDRYREVVARFEKYLGPDRCAQDVCRLGVSDFAEFRDMLAKSVKPVTANLAIKILSAAMKSAWREGLIAENPAAKVEGLKTRAKDAHRRRPFTMQELKLILDHANTEWKGLILCGIYTGQRMGDLVRLRWANVDLTKEEIRFETQKTGRIVILPMAKPLLAYFLSLPSADDSMAPVFPDAFKVIERDGRVNNLSNQFYEIQVAAGLATKKTHKKAEDGKGREVRRHQNELVFHSLRHTATSLLKNAGVSDAVAMDIIGHESKAISQNYTHIDEDAKRRAFAKLPDITAGLPGNKARRSSRKQTKAGAQE